MNAADRIVSNIFKCIVANDPTKLTKASIVWLADYYSFYVCQQLPDSLTLENYGKKADFDKWRNSGLLKNQGLQDILVSETCLANSLTQLNHSWVHYPEFRKASLECVARFKYNLSIVYALRKKMTWLKNYRFKYLYFKQSWRKWTAVKANYSCVASSPKDALRRFKECRSAPYKLSKLKITGYDWQHWIYNINNFDKELTQLIVA